VPYLAKWSATLTLGLLQDRPFTHPRGIVVDDPQG